MRNGLTGIERCAIMAVVAARTREIADSDCFRRDYEYVCTD